MSLDPVAVPLVAPQKRSCLGCLGGGALGCLAFLAGGIAAAALLAPSLLGGVTARFVERDFASKHGGSLDVARVNLAWRESQVVDGLSLREPSGKSFLKGELRLPGLLDLANSSAWSVVARIDTLDWTIDEEGLSSWGRCLARTDGEQPLSDLKVGGFNLGERFERLYLLNLNLTLVSGRIRDMRHGGRPVLLDEFQFEFVRRGGDEVELTGQGRVGVDGTFGEVQFEWRGPLDGSSPVVATVSAVGVPTAAVAALTSAGGLLQELLGSEFDFSGSVEGDPSVTATLDAELQSDCDVRLAAVIEQGHLRPRDTGLQGSLMIPSSLCETLLARRLPAGIELERLEPRSWKLASTEFDLPLGFGTGQPLSASECLAGCRLEAALTGAETAALVDAETRAELVPIVDPRLAVHVAPGAPPSLSVGCPARAEHLGFELELVAGRPLPVPAAEWTTSSYQLEAPQLSVALLDHILELDGLLTELFGDTLQVGITHDRGNPDSPVELALATLEGLPVAALELGAGVVRLGFGEPVSLRLPYGPKLRARVLERLMPWMRDLEGDALTLTLSDVCLPYGDSGLEVLAGRVRIDLGEVRTTIHTGFDGLFSAPREGPPATPHGRPFAGRLLPVKLRLAGPLVSYEELSLPLCGEDVDFEGSLHLAEGTLDLSAEVQLALVAGEIGVPENFHQALYEVDYPVTLQLSGAWDQPKMNLPAEVMRELLQGDLTRLLRKVPGFEALQGGLEQIFLSEPETSSSGDGGE